MFIEHTDFIEKTYKNQIRMSFLCGCNLLIFLLKQVSTTRAEGLIFLEQFDFIVKISRCWCPKTL